MAFSSSLFTLALISIVLRSFPVLFDVLSKATAVIALISLFYTIRSVLTKNFFNKPISPINKAVLITGCDSGFGHLLAQRLDELGFHVFAACLYPSGRGAEDLKNTTSQKLQILGLDVTNHQSVLNALEFVKKNLQSEEVLWAVVNNAGIGQVGEIEWTSVEEFQRVFDVNTMGIVRVTKAFLPLLRKSKGRVVNTTSLCGKLTSPGYVAYCMSKTAAVSFSSGLRMEMLKWGVKVISIEPFFFRTPITETDRNLKLLESTFDEAPQDIKEAYGEEYLNGFKKSCRRLLARSSLNVEEVIKSFEDAITAEEPQIDYFPCYFPHKVILKLSAWLPQSMVERCQVTQMSSVKPAALRQ